MSAIEDSATWRKPLFFSLESQMLIRETIHKTKALLHKSLRKFQSFFYGGYQKLPRSLSFRPFLCGTVNARTHTSDQFYNEYYDHLQSDLSLRFSSSSNMSKSKLKEPAIGDSACSFMSYAKEIPHKRFHEDRTKEKKNKMGKKGESNSHNMNKGAHVLAQKIKELDMMAAGDLEHVLDIEEALHYYSRLRSPVYLDIVDQFFMDMHSELSVPQPSVSIKTSKKRYGSIQL